MKILSLVLRILIGLFLLMPVAGAFGLFPEPTAEMYSPEGWAYMSALMATGYMMGEKRLSQQLCLHRSR
ncbi:MAG: hypothetical protein AAB853_05535 [Patescibacteria group bacterium]